MQHGSREQWYGTSCTNTGKKQKEVTAAIIDEISVTIQALIRDYQ
jgi:hypothetical protein